MKKFLVGLMLSCVAMFSFSVVGNCMTQQTIKSGYLLIREDSWFKLEVEQQAKENRYIALKRDWHQKVMIPPKTIVEKRPNTTDGSPPLVREVLQEPRDFNLSIPIEDGFLGPQVASFNVKLKNNNKSIEDIVSETTQPEEVMEVKFMNIGGSGTTYEKEIDLIGRQLAESDPLHINDVKIISFNTGVRSYGYIFTPSLDVPLENASICFSCGGHKNNQFDNLNTFLDSYWKGQELKARALGFYLPR